MSSRRRTSGPPTSRLINAFIRILLPLDRQPRRLIVGQHSAKLADMGSGLSPQSRLRRAAKQAFRTCGTAALDAPGGRCELGHDRACRRPDKPAKDPALYSPLARFEGRAPDAPRWFADALARKPEERMIDGRRRGDRNAGLGRDRQAGPAAAARQWRARRLVSLHRPVFRATSTGSSPCRGPAWARPTGARTIRSTISWRRSWRVARATGLFAGLPKPVIVGHSFGSFPLAEAACRHGERFSRRRDRRFAVPHAGTARAAPPRARGQAAAPARTGRRTASIRRWRPRWRGSGSRRSSPAPTSTSPI